MILLNFILFVSIAFAVSISHLTPTAVALGLWLGAGFWVGLTYLLTMGYLGELVQAQMIEETVDGYLPQRQRELSKPVRRRLRAAIRHDVWHRGSPDPTDGITDSDAEERYEQALMQARTSPRYRLAIIRTRYLLCVTTPTGFLGSILLHGRWGTYPDLTGVVSSLGLDAFACLGMAVQVRSSLGFDPRDHAAAQRSRYSFVRMFLLDLARPKTSGSGSSE